jgi:rod shape-determining protein MreC
VRALLDSTSKVGDQVLIAEIVAVDMDRFRHRVVINRGSANGAFVGQALIDAHGVVGQVTRDRGASAEALLITDPDHAVPTQVVRTGLRTIAVGTGDLERLSLPFVARNSDIRRGDVLVTSGLGGTFPAGYPVGTVSEVRGDSGEPFLAVTATPAARVDRVREVLLVIPQPQPPPAPPAQDQQPATAEAPAATAPQAPAAPAEAAAPPTEAPTE